MGRLKALPSRLAALPPVIHSRADAEGHDEDLQARKWMKSRRWKALRWEVLVRDRFTCQCGCGRTEPDTAMLVADHRQPHRGDPRLFWDRNNLQTLWKPHHDREKQRSERAAPR
jgi:5-methylcytosine-specific restriction endonuclease McrA